MREAVTNSERPSSRLAPPASDWPSEADVLARMGGENFPVALRILPRTMRQRLRAIYAYARFVDQLGDAYDGDRLGALDRLGDQLDAALGGAVATAELHPAVAPAVAMVRELGAGGDQLAALVAANRMDQRIAAYASFEDLVGYCHLSADPVGRLVLVALGASTPERVAWSDRVCTALQLAEHWQDLTEDVLAGRVYLPGEDLARFGVDQAELRATALRRGPASPALRGLVAFETARARTLLREGEPLVGSLCGWARVAVAGFVAGGHAALDALAGAGYDPFTDAPRPGRLRTLRHAAAVFGAPRRLSQGYLLEAATGAPSTVGGQ